MGVVQVEKSLVTLQLTGTTKYSKKEMLENFDPLLIEKVNVLISNILDCECCLTVEDVELLAIESIKENG